MATETKVTHTPGPWGKIIDPKGKWGITGPDRIFLAITDTEANALLISLSPELLAELKLVVSHFDYNPGHSDLDNEQPIHLPITLGDYRRIRSLIHRAEGK